MKMQGRNSHSCQLGMAVPDIPRGHLKGEPSTVWQIKERLSGKSESKPGATAHSKCLRALNHALCGRQHSHRFLSSDTELYCWLKARLSWSFLPGGDQEPALKPVSTGTPMLLG